MHRFAMIPSAILVAWAAFSAPFSATMAEAAERPRFESFGFKLPGPQMLYDAGFELLDWNGDGKLDLFLPNTSMMSFAVHLNEGSQLVPVKGRIAIGSHAAAGPAPRCQL
jgi:hypothetical protein